MILGTKDAQQWLNEEYPLARRSEIKVIDGEQRHLTGSLSISGFPR